MRQLIWAGVILLLGILLYSSLTENSIKTNLFALLPDEQNKNIPQQAVDAYSEKLSRKVIYLFTANNDQSAIHLAELNIPKLEKSQLYSDIKAKVTDQELAAYNQSFESYQFSLLSAKDRAGLIKQPSSWLITKLTKLLISPVSGLDSNSLSNDPFLLYRDYLTELPRGNPKAQLVNGYTLFHENNQSHVLVLTELANGAFIQNIQDQFSQLQSELNTGGLEQQTIKVFGVIRYALQNRELAEKEMLAIGLGSLIGIMLIFYLVFRRLLFLPIILLPIAIGGLSAFSVSLFIFGELHLISLVFGVSLIGVSIDYALHYCCSHSNLSNSNDNIQALTEVRSALSLGLVTSSIGYLTLSIADFPALRQMAALAIAGLAGAYFTVLFWLPTLIKKPLKVQPVFISLVSVWINWLRDKKPVSIWFVVLLVVVLYGLNYFSKNNQDNVKILRANLVELEIIDKYVQKVIGEFPNSQFFVVSGKSKHETIKNERELVKQIRQIDSGAGRVYALSDWFPDYQQQEQNYNLLQQNISQNKTLGTDLAKAGLPEGLLDKYREKLSGSNFTPMNLDVFLNSPLGKIHKHLWLGEVEGQFYSIVSLYGYKDLQILNSIADELSVSLIDRSASISNLLAKYRVTIERMFPLVLLAIFIILSFRFGLHDSFRVVSAPLLAAMLSFLCLNIIVGSYNLFSIFGLIITIAISIDYAIFIRESKGYSKGTYLAISLASITTILALGLLSLSFTPALSAFGLSLLLGVLFSLVLTPIIVRPKTS